MELEKLSSKDPVRMHDTDHNIFPYLGSKRIIQAKGDTVALSHFKSGVGGR